jgi:hypothetical protein
MMVAPLFFNVFNVQEFEAGVFLEGVAGVQELQTSVLFAPFIQPDAKECRLKLL